MNFNTKLNIGDTVWHISTREGCIRETTIIGVTIVHKPTDYYQGQCETKVIYESNDHHNFAEESEGKYWWATRKGIIDYLTKTLKSVGNGKKSNPVAAPRQYNSIAEEFDDFFRDELPSPPQEHFKIVPPSMKSTNKELRKIFEDVFGKPPTQPVKKTRCDCGVHRISELQRRAQASAKSFLKTMKPLPGIREKTLTDYADEL